MPATRPVRPATGVALALPRVGDETTQRAFDRITIASQQLVSRIGAVDTSLTELTASTAGAATWINVQTFGVLGNGAADDTAALQKAIANSPGKTLFMPAGTYRVTSTLFITTTSTHIVGDFGNRVINNGTEIVYYGTGPCIQIGVDNGHAWNAGDYDGPQDHLIEHVHISHGAPDTALVSAGDAVARYKAGAYGIWDWRGGGVILRNVGLEKFEANFVAIESDFDDLDLSASLYSKYGIYIGPRSDQFTLKLRNSFYCDRAITVDGARQVRILSSSFVGSGTATESPIEVRRGSAAVEVIEPWFEHLQGYAGTDQQSFVSAGEVDGYGAGGSIQSPGGAPETRSVEGLSVRDPFTYTTGTGVANHTRYLVSVGKCKRLIVDRPVSPPGVSLSNLSAIIGVQAAQAPTNAETQIEYRGASSDTPLASHYTNLGAGSPAVQIWATGATGCSVTTSSRFRIIRPGAAAGADDLQISQEGSPGQVYLIAPQYTGGQTTRMRITRAVQPGTAAAAPTTGTWERGDRVYNEDATAGGFIGWVCTAGGTPGTWKSFGAISP